MGKSAGYLLHTIIDALVNDLFHILMKIQGNLDDVEDAVFDDRVEVVKGISILSREITHLKTIIFPLKRIAYEITNDIQKFSEEDLTKYFNDVEDHINKALEIPILCLVQKGQTGFSPFLQYGLPYQFHL